LCNDYSWMQFISPISFYYLLCKAFGNYRHLFFHLRATELHGRLPFRGVEICMMRKSGDYRVNIVQKDCIFAEVKN